MGTSTIASGRSGCTPAEVPPAAAPGVPWLQVLEGDTKVQPAGGKL